jgi:hypothetical protein
VYRGVDIISDISCEMSALSGFQDTALSQGCAVTDRHGDIDEFCHTLYQQCLATASWS